MSTLKQKPLTKSQLVADLADKAGFDKKVVNAVLQALYDVVERELKRGPGLINLIGLIKLKKVDKPATKERTGPDPFNKGQMRTFAAKPKRTVAKAVVLKGLKDMLA